MLTVPPVFSFTRSANFCMPLEIGLSAGWFSASLKLKVVSSDWDGVPAAEEPAGAPAGADEAAGLEPPHPVMALAANAAARDTAKNFFISISPFVSLYFLQRALNFASALCQWTLQSDAVCKEMQVVFHDDADRNCNRIGGRLDFFHYIGKKKSEAADAFIVGVFIGYIATTIFHIPILFSVILGMVFESTTQSPCATHGPNICID